jgi:hypothetical protein
MTPTRALIEAAEAVANLICIDPTTCKHKYHGPTYDNLRAAISSAKAAEEGVETAEEAWKRGYLAGALHVSDDFGVELCGLAIEEYSAPKSISVREKEGL